MHLFLTDDTTGPYATLSPDESKHCIRVLRMGLGSELLLTSGDGTMCRARVIAPDDRACEVEIIERDTQYQARPFRLHLAVAPTKNTARLEWFIEKAVEIGIDQITLLVCQHSERAKQNTDRLQKIIDSAMKQSLKALRPQLQGPMPIMDFLHSLPSSTTKLVCYCSGQERQTLRQVYQPGHDAVVLIGPEGDFSPQEISTALGLGFQPVTLGSCRLRTETAALYATTAINFINEP
ncbi:MAG: 16S rRNA (uracil(1498)-N(3))-methyltransferase [Bacteroidales bacterium]|nr:16S rRNA (uracil(1498)-N(3))-methyltransferase [Bacteroidales bacterium]